MRVGFLKKISWIVLAAIIVLSNALTVLPSTASASTDGASGQAQASALPDGTGKKVLFDNTHGQTAGAADWVIDGAFSDFANGLRTAGFTVDSLDRQIPYTFGEQAVTYSKLINYDVFIIGEANIPYKKSEQDAMLQYVQNGGSIFFIADHYNADRNKNRWDASEVMNGFRRGAWDNPAQGMSAEEAASPAMQDVQSSDWLADNFGVRFRYNALGDVDHLTDVVAPDQSFGITAGVGSVAMHAGSTLAIMDPAKAKGLVYVPTDVPAWNFAVDSGVYSGGGRAEGPFAAISKLGAGKAAFIGDSSPVEDKTPKYLREDDGKTKTTYDGFNGEADDAVFLVQTVKWLANKESYTRLDHVPGLELDQPTPLLDFETPARSTEPQPEPWEAPNAGYKWYDPTTFRAGAYGSTQKPPLQPVYNFVHQNTLPNKEQFQIRLTVDNLLPGQTASGLSVGIYLTGGTQVAKFQNADGTWPTSYGYSSAFSATADSTGHAHKELTVQINPSVAGSANLRLKVNGANTVTKTVTIANVPAEPLPPDRPSVPDSISIASARNASNDTLVTVEGVITSEPGAFGGQGFYLQDDTAGIYVFQNDAGYHAGDRISISATKTVYNTELELTDPVVLEKIGIADLPAPIVQPALNEENQGRLVTLEHVFIQNYKTASPSGSFEFDVVNGLGSTHVRIDGRTGISYNAFKAAFPEGSFVNLTGISSIFKGTYQLKPLHLNDAVFADIIGPEITYEGSTAFYQTDEAVNLVVTVTDNLSGVKAVTYTLDGQPIDSIASIPPLALSAGEHELLVSAVDFAGNPSSLTIVLTAVMDADHLDELIAIGENKGLFANHGTVQSMLSHVKNLQKAKAENQAGLLDTLIKQIGNDSGKLIDAAFAQLLIDDLTYMKADGL